MYILLKLYATTANYVDVRQGCVTTTLHEFIKVAAHLPMKQANRNTPTLHAVIKNH